MRRSLVPFLVLVFVILSPGTAFPWGIAPTHFSIGNDLANNVKYSILPATDDPQLFIRANVCPDIAWTPNFPPELAYIHTFDFASALYQVALANNNPNWRTIAHAYGAHLAADEIVHTYLADVDDTIHSLVEVSIDTIIYYHGTPIHPPTAPLEWKNVNVWFDACDPVLFILASSYYQTNTDPVVQLISQENMQSGVLDLATAIFLEYGYIELKGNSNLSEAWLQTLKKEGVLQGSWEKVYGDSLKAAEQWILTHY